MEIGLWFVLAIIAIVYFSAPRKQTLLHQTFSIILIAVLVHLVFDGVTVYTVNHLDTVPALLNELVHRIFLGSMVLIEYLFYRYIAILVEEETGKPRKFDMVAGVYLLVAEAGEMFLPIHYAITVKGN